MKKFLKSCIRFVREAWLMLGNALAFFLALELCLTVISWLAPGPRQVSNADDVDILQIAYEGETWREDYNDEFRNSRLNDWKPYVYWRRRPFQGRLINVDASNRRATYQPPVTGDGSEKPFRIFVFGGSTAWGTAARDDFTIPSELSKELTRRGLQVEIQNFGEAGFVSTQEILTLMLELRAGRIPDLAIFYDGVNDTYSAFQNGVAGIPQNEDNRVQEFNFLKPYRAADRHRLMRKEFANSLAVTQLLKRLAAKVKPAPAPNEAASAASDEDALASEVVTVYLENMRIIRSLAREYNFAYLSFWQPTLFEKPLRTEHEQERLAAFDKGGDQFFRKTYDHFRTLEKSQLDELRIFDLSQVFAEMDDPLFIDFCHVREPGNKIVARYIADEVLRQFADRVGSRAGAPATEP
jgi:hypothetical protein